MISENIQETCMVKIASFWLPSLLWNKTTSMGKASLVSLLILLPACGSSPERYGGLTSWGVEGVAMATGCTFEEIQIINKQIGWKVTKWDAYCSQRNQHFKCRAGYEIDAPMNMICEEEK